MRGVPLLLSEGGRVPLVSAGALLEARPERLVLDVADQAEIRGVLGEVLGSMRASRGFGANTVDRTGRWVAAAGSPLDVAVSAAAAAATDGDVVLVRPSQRPSQRPILPGTGTVVIVGGTAAVPAGFAGDEG